MSPPTPSSSTTTPLPDSDWSKRHKAISFRRLIAVKPHRNNTTNASTAIFTSLSASFPPTPTPRSYGGHVFAQAAWAATYTIPFGMNVHSMTGYFLEVGDTRYAFRYVVRRVRTGGIYAIRYIEAYQDAGEAIKGNGSGSVLCFVATIGFKRDESGKHQGLKPQRRDFDHQALPRDWLAQEYGAVLFRKLAFEDWPLCQGMDGLWNTSMSIEKWKQRGDAFPGLEMRKVDMSGYNPDPKSMPIGGAQGGDDGKAARSWRLLLLYRLIDDGEGLSGSIDKDKDKSKHKMGADDIINLHACAHLYASDRNSLFLPHRALGFQDTRGQTGSLSHTVNFHGHAKDWLMIDQQTGKAKEYVQEIWTSDSGADRVMHNSRLWDKTTGRIIASTVQDGMMRIPVKGPSTSGLVDGDAIMRREAKL